MGSNLLKGFDIAMRSFRAIGISLLCLIAASQSSSIALEKTFFSKLSDLTVNCVKSKSQYSCHQAISFSDQLQREAGLRGEYSCQTRLLGLGADMGRLLLDPNKGKYILQSLKDVKLFCNEL